MYYCQATLFFQAAVSVCIRPCCPTLLSCIKVHVLLLFERINDDDDDDDDEISQRKGRKGQARVLTRHHVV